MTSLVMSMRKNMVGWAHWCHANIDSIHYAETRPIPYLRPGMLPFTTDCTGIITMIAQWSGMPDPNGMGYNGSGFTGTMLMHLPGIELDETWRGDIAVFGPGSGTHAVTLLQGGLKVPDPLVMSHGHPGLDDPQILPLSQAWAADDVHRYLHVIPDQ